MPTTDCTNKERFDIPFSAAATVIIKDSRALVKDLCLYFNNGKHELCCILIHTETGSEGMSCNTISRKDATTEELLICWCSKTIPGSRTGSYVITVAEGEFDCTASSPEPFRRGGSPAPGGEKVSLEGWESCPGPLCSAPASLALSEPSMPAGTSAS